MSKAVKGVTKVVSSVVGNVAGKPAVAAGSTAPAAAAAAPVGRYQPIYTNEIFGRDDLKYTGAFGNGDFNRWLADPANSAAKMNYDAWKTTNSEGALPTPAPVKATATGGNGTTVIEQTLPGAPQEQDQVVLTARDNERVRRLRAAAGNDTFITGLLGALGEASTAAPQLLGA